MLTWYVAMLHVSKPGRTSELSNPLQVLENRTWYIVMSGTPHMSPGNSLVSTYIPHIHEKTPQARPASNGRLAPIRFPHSTHAPITTLFSANPYVPLQTAVPGNGVVPHTALSALHGC